MINLIPASLKEELTYARWNATIVHYLKLVAALAAVLGLGFGGTYFYLNQRIASVDAGLVQKQATVASYKPTIDAAKSLNDRVAAIKTIQQDQPKFSLLLDDIAKFTLRGTAIASIALTGDDTKPVQINATADSYSSAVSLRDALASSPRVSGADIISIASNNAAYNVSILIGFKPGQAR